MGNFGKNVIVEGTQYRFRLGLPDHVHDISVRGNEWQEWTNDGDRLTSLETDRTKHNTNSNLVPQEAINNDYDTNTNTYPMRIKANYVELWVKP
ncbi:MAG: hypothetical protein LBH98_06400 [Chitinispirillales bacterium]|jgi:hypothetical protein|nr:hypothetical protein [Chitinispirillales bacterium]